MHNIVRVLLFQQLLAKKHHKLRDYMAEWENVPLDPRTTTKKKQRVNLEPPRPMAARLINYTKEDACVVAE